MDDAGPGGAGRQSSTSAPGGAYFDGGGARGSLSVSGGTRGAAPCGGGGPRGGGPRGGRGAALGGLWRGEYQLDDPSLLLLRTVSYQTFDASLPALRAVSCQAAGGDGEPVVEAADSRGVYQRSSSRRAIALLWLPLLGLPYAQ